MDDFKLPDRPMTDDEMREHFTSDGVGQVMVVVWGPKPWAERPGPADPGTLRRFIRHADGLWRYDR